jgi:translocation and assembly module TamB
MTGNVSPDRNLDLMLSARALPTDGSRTRAGDAEIGRLAFNGTVQGTLAAPRINGSLEAADVRLPEGSVSALNARLAMNPIGGTPSAERFSISPAPWETGCP